MNGDMPILALKALDGLALRAEAVAQNIANAQTPGYRPLAVRFEQALARAAATSDSAMNAFVPHTIAAPALFGSSDLRLDLELQTAAATAQRYAAIVSVLDRALQMQSLAASGGK